MDASGVESTVVATVCVEQHKCLTIAALFCGDSRFSGWSQASWLMHRAGLPAQTLWKVDNDPAVVPMQKCQDPSLAVVYEQDDLALPEDGAQALILADVWSQRWLRPFCHTPPNTGTVSSLRGHEQEQVEAWGFVMGSSSSE